MSKVKDKLEKTVVMGARSLSSPIRQNPFERYRLNSDKQYKSLKFDCIPFGKQKAK